MPGEVSGNCTCRPAKFAIKRIFFETKFVKFQNLTKFKIWQNSKFDENPKFDENQNLRSLTLAIQILILTTKLSKFDEINKIWQFFWKIQNLIKNWPKSKFLAVKYHNSPFRIDPIFQNFSKSIRVWGYIRTHKIQILMSIWWKIVENCWKLLQNCWKLLKIAAKLLQNCSNRHNFDEKNSFNEFLAFSWLALIVH